MSEHIEGWRASGPSRLDYPRKPRGSPVVIHYGDVAESERRWFGPVPATAPLRTLEDCAAEHLPPELLRSAALDAVERGLVASAKLDAIQTALAPFGGLEP
ncbi:MAG: hypothetical protein Tsb0020_19130 [Haliangiales bacterium]